MCAFANLELVAAALVAAAGFEPAISASPGARRAHFHGRWRW